jgi:hypothetical protein
VTPPHHLSFLLSVRRIRPRNRCQLRLPLIPIAQQLLLIIQQLLPRLRGILRIRPLDNRINRTALLTHPAVNALGHIDIVSGCAARAVLALLGFDGDGGGRADGFAELAGDAAFFAGGVPAEGVFAAESGGDGTFFVGVVDCVSVAADFSILSTSPACYTLCWVILTYGGRKNCSIKIHIPLNISPSKK